MGGTSDVDAEPATHPDAGVRAPAGWYPDYHAPPGHERYWNGERWTDGRRTTAAARSPLPTVLWVSLALALVAAIALYVTVGRDAPSPTPAANRPGPSSTPGSPNPSLSASTTSEPDPNRRTWRVTQALDGTTLELDNGAEVRLVGIAAPTSITCATTSLFELAELTEGQAVTLTRRGPDKDAENHLLRYVEVDGLDVGLALIRRGLATATDERHARGEIYRRIAARTESAC